jgi:hypothetical protein
MVRADKYVCELQRCFGFCWRREYHEYAAASSEQGEGVGPWYWPEVDAIGSWLHFQLNVHIYFHPQSGNWVWLFWI